MAYPNLPWVHVIEWQFLMILNLNVRHSSSFNFKLHLVVLSNILLDQGGKKQKTQYLNTIHSLQFILFLAREKSTSAKIARIGKGILLKWKIYKTYHQNSTPKKSFYTIHYISKCQKEKQTHITPNYQLWQMYYKLLCNRGTKLFTECSRDYQSKSLG